MSSPMCQQRGPGYAPTTGCGTDPGAGHRRHGCAAVAVGSPRQELLPRTVGVCGTGGRISSVAATRCGNIICCVLRLEELFLRTIRKAIDKNWVWTGISEAYGWWGVNLPPNLGMQSCVRLQYVVVGVRFLLNFTKNSGVPGTGDRGWNCENEPQAADAPQPGQNRNRPNSQDPPPRAPPPPIFPGPISTPIL